MYMGILKVMVGLSAICELDCGVVVGSCMTDTPHALPQGWCPGTSDCIKGLVNAQSQAIWAPGIAQLLPLVNPIPLVLPFNDIPIQ